MHQNGEGRKTRGGEEISAPVSQKERGESRFLILAQFRSTWNQLQCTCQKGVTASLSCHVYRKKIAFHAYTFSSQHIYAFLLFPISSLGRPALDLKTVHTVSNVYQNIDIVMINGAILCPSNCTKMHIMASDFSKTSRGSMPPDPLAGLGLRPSFCRLYASWMVPRNIPALVMWPVRAKKIFQVCRLLPVRSGWQVLQLSCMGNWVTVFGPVGPTSCTWLNNCSVIGWKVVIWCMYVRETSEAWEGIRPLRQLWLSGRLSFSHLAPLIDHSSTLTSQRPLLEPSDDIISDSWAG